MVLEDKFYIGYSDINSEKKLSNSGILKIFENIAGMHGNIAGDNILYSDSRWVLSGHHVKIADRPLYGTKVIARTWVREIRGASSIREYELVSEDGEKLVTGLSLWAHIDAQKGTLSRVSEERAQAYEAEPELSNFNKERLQRLSEPEQHCYSKEFYIDRNWIDINRHMNNVYYLDLASLVLPNDVYALPESDEFEITYKKEIKYASFVRCYYLNDGDAYNITVKNQDTGELNAVIRLYKNETMERVLKT